MQCTQRSFNEPCKEAAQQHGWQGYMWFVDIHSIHCIITYSSTMVSMVPVDRLYHMAVTACSESFCGTDPAHWVQVLAPGRDLAQADCWQARLQYASHHSVVAVKHAVKHNIAQQIQQIRSSCQHFKVLWGSSRLQWAHPCCTSTVCRLQLGA